MQLTYIRGDTKLWGNFEYVINVEKRAYNYM
jgi:hypothetical protein